MIDEGVKSIESERAAKDSSDGGVGDTLSSRVGIVNNRRGINQSPIRVFIALLNGTAGAWRRFYASTRKTRQRESELERER